MSEINSKSAPRRHMQGPGMGRGPGGPGGHGPVEKAKDFKGTIKKLIKYLSKYHFAIIMVIIFAAGSTIFNVMGPKILGRATTEVYNGVISKFNGGSGIDIEKIGSILLTLILLYVLSWVFSFVQGIIMTGVAQKTAYNMRKEISEKINRLPMEYYDKRTFGNILSVITNDVDTLGMNLNQTVTQIVTSVSTIIGVLIMMLSISPLMTIIALLILPVSAFVVKILLVTHKNTLRHSKTTLAR